jgi:hypothetical protein
VIPMATLQMLADYDEAPGIVASPARIDAWMEIAKKGDVFTYATRLCLPVNSAGAKRMRELAKLGLVMLTRPRSVVDPTVFNYRAVRTEKATPLTRPERAVLVAPSAKLVNGEAAIVDALLPVLERFAQHARPCPTDKQLAAKAVLTEAEVKDGLVAMTAAHLIKIVGCAAPTYRRIVIFSTGAITGLARA